MSGQPLSLETHSHTWMILQESVRGLSSSAGAASQRRRHGQQDPRPHPVRQLRVLPGLRGPHSRGREEAESQQTFDCHRLLGEPGGFRGVSLPHPALHVLVRLPADQEQHPAPPNMPLESRPQPLPLLLEATRTPQGS